MSYNLILVDVGYGDRIPTTIHKIDVITGDYLSPSYLIGDMTYQLREIAKMIIADKPNKIVFDKFGMGFEYHQRFADIIKLEEYESFFSVDAFGLIIFK